MDERTGQAVLSGRSSLAVFCPPLTVVFKGVYECVTVALVRKLREFYNCVTAVHLNHTLVRRIWTTHFSILITKYTTFQMECIKNKNKMKSTLCKFPPTLSAHNQIIENHTA